MKLAVNIAFFLFKNLTQRSIKVFRFTENMRFFFIFLIFSLSKKFVWIWVGLIVICFYLFFFFFMFEIRLFIIKTLFLLIIFILSISFLTLGERKLMAVIQHRQGPFEVGFRGIIQPLADGVKLLAKESFLPRKAFSFLFFFAPIFLLILSFINIFFLLYDTTIVLLNFNFTLILFFVISALEVYGIIFAGWGSNSRFAFLGALRTAAQMLAYELVLGFCFLSVVLITQTYSLSSIYFFQKNYILFFLLLPFSLIFLIVGLAETNRVPFDLPEAESELVAGYNVEYAGFIFALFFLGEYANVILFSHIFILLFWGGVSFFFLQNLYIIFFFKLIILLIFFVGIRALLPRIRFDQLLGFGWKYLLPFTVCCFLLEFCICLLIK